MTSNIIVSVATAAIIIIEYTPDVYVYIIITGEWS